MLIRTLNDIWTALRSFDDQALSFSIKAVLVYVIFIVLKNIVLKICGRKCDRLWQMALSVCLFGILCVYLSYLVSLTLSGREAGSRTNKINLEIFGTWRSDGTMSAHALENMMLFVPFGLLVPLAGRFFKKWWNLVLLAIISSLLIETLQLVTARGYFETDDILLNTVGAILGYTVFWFFYHSYVAFKHQSQLPLSKHEQQLSRISLFVVQLIPVILCVFLIFGFGDDDAERSTELSRFVTEKLLYIVNKLMGLEWTAEKIKNSVDEYEGYVRTGAHFAEFGLFTFFTFVFLYCRRIKNRLAFLLTLILSAAIAVADEINQGFSDGRNSSVKDVAIDCIGSFVVLVMVNLILLMIRIYRNKIKTQHHSEDICQT